MNSDQPIDLTAPRPARGAAAVAIAAVALASLFMVLLSARPLSSPDLGYHLAYGEHFWSTGQVVDYNPYIYTLPDPKTPVSQRPAAGPGCWYDSQGRYRFPNANWLMQVIVAAINQRADFAGLCWMQVILVAGICGLTIVSMRRLGIPLPMAATGILLIGLASFERFLMRPELFGFVALVAQLCLLLTRRLTWRTALALMLVQLLFVNLHSYFMLGLVLTTCWLADRLSRIAWNAMKEPHRRDKSAEFLEIRRGAKVLAFALAGQLAVCFINPWTWRLAVLPFQTLLFISENDINGGTLQSITGHPWAIIGEFFKPLIQDESGGITVRGNVASYVATYAYLGVLAVAVGGIIASAARKRWTWLLVLTAMTMVSLSMRRNIAPAAMVIVPLGLAACWEPLGGLARRLSGPRAKSVPLAAGAVLAAVAAILCLSVITNRFYYIQRLPTRFAIGISRMDIPLAAADWINEHQPLGRLWMDYADSSNLYYFTRPHRDVPLITNTWAYPPEVMARLLDGTRLRAVFDESVRQYGIEIVSIKVDGRTADLVGELARDKQWRVVHIDTSRVVFLRADGPNATLAAQCAITPQDFNIKAYKDLLLQSDPVPAFAACIGGETLFLMGWDDPAIKVMETCVSLDPSHGPAWNQLGVSYARRADARLTGKDPRGWADLNKAVESFQTALDNGCDVAEANLQQARRRLAERP